MGLFVFLWNIIVRSPTQGGLETSASATERGLETSALTTEDDRRNRNIQLILKKNQTSFLQKMKFFYCTLSLSL